MLTLSHCLFYGYLEWRFFLSLVYTINIKQANAQYFLKAININISHAHTMLFIDYIGVSQME